MPSGPRWDYMRPLPMDDDETAVDVVIQGRFIDQSSDITLFTEREGGGGAPHRHIRDSMGEAEGPREIVVSHTDPEPMLDFYGERGNDRVEDIAERYGNVDDLMPADEPDILVTGDPEAIRESAEARARSNVDADDTLDVLDDWRALAVFDRETVEEAETLERARRRAYLFAEAQDVDHDEEIVGDPYHLGDDYGDDDVTEAIKTVAASLRDDEARGDA